MLQADGGTRTAAITGSYVALHQALAEIRRRSAAAGRAAHRQRRRDLVRRVRGGGGARPRLRRGFAADADANFVLTGTGGIVEIQATAEGAPFDEAEFPRAGAGARASPS